MQIWLLSDMFNLVYIYIYMLLVGIPEGVIRMFQLSCGLSTWKKDIEATVLLLIKKKKVLRGRYIRKGLWIHNPHLMQFCLWKRSLAVRQLPCSFREIYLELIDCQLLPGSRCLWQRSCKCSNTRICDLPNRLFTNKLISLVYMAIG